MNKLDNITKNIAEIQKLQQKANRPLFKNLLKLQTNAIKLGFNINEVSLTLQNKHYGYEELEEIEDRLMGINITVEN